MIKFKANRKFLSNCYKNNIKKCSSRKTLFKNCTYILTSKDVKYRQKPDLDSYFDLVTFALIYVHSQRLYSTLDS